MKKLLLPVLATGALALSAPALLAASAADRAAPATPAASRDWNTTFTVTPEGHKVGNPAAATSLVAFISYTCPHCAEFEKESDIALQASYIRSGKVSLEVRNFIRNPIDLAAALAVECGEPARFFARHRAMLRSQDAWMKVATSANQAQQQRWSTGPVPARMRAIASDLDFYELFEGEGLTRSQLDRCLSDEARARAIATQSQAQGVRYSVPGTPSFLVNGKLLDNVHSWAGLQTALDARS